MTSWLLFAVQYPVKMVKSYYSRQFYYIVFEGTIIFTIFSCYITICLLNRSPINIAILSSFLIYFVGIYLYFHKALSQKKHRKNENYHIGGFRKSANIYEIHVGQATPKKFYDKLTKTIYYCQKKNLFLEYIAANMTEDELHSEYGEAIVDIRRLGLYSRIIFKGFAYKRLNLLFNKQLNHC
jgi:hypothetical protein